MPAFVRFSYNNHVGKGLLIPKNCDYQVAEIEGSIYEGWRATGNSYPIMKVRLLSPCTPTKIIGVGVNSRKMACQLGVEVPSLPTFFLKPPSSVVGPGEAITLPPNAGRVDFEAEPAVVIGKKAKDIRVHEAKNYILGYTCANDVTAVEKVVAGQPGALAKGFDTFTPLGPSIVTNINPDRLTLESYLNGERKQWGSTGDYVHKAYDIVAYVSQVMTLEPGDVIMIGTVSGKGPLTTGDEIEVRISGIGCLKNKVEVMR